jgi:Undecaprenyl-phosphate galactose phosphotransferase WbaP
VIKLEILRGRAALVTLILLLGDIVSFLGAFALATFLRYAAIPWMGGEIFWDILFPMLYINLAAVLLTYAITGMYPGFGRTAVEEMRQIFYSLTLGYAVLGLVVYFQKISPYFPRSVFLLGWAFAFLLNLAVRVFIRNRASLLPWWGIPVIVVGPAAESTDVIRRLLQCRRLGLKPVLLLDEQHTSAEPHILGVPIIQSRAQMEEIAALNQVRYAVFVEAPQDQARLSQPGSHSDLRWLSRLFPTVMIVLSNPGISSLWVRTVDLEGRLTLQASYHLLSKPALIVKRIFDLGLGSLLAILSAPFMLLILLLIRLDSPGPAIYAQERIGLHGNRIQYLKFRTMRLGAEQLLQELLEKDPQRRLEYETHHKLVRDPRVTRVGRFLRKFSLDELPQLYHVLTGDLSLVGPRAYMPNEYAQMGSYAELILQVRPGLTGWWQVMGRHTTTFQQRLQLDEYYLSNWSLWLDIYILLKTAWVVLSGIGA